MSIAPINPRWARELLEWAHGDITNDWGQPKRLPYILALTRLRVATGSPSRSLIIFKTVVEQGTTLGKSSSWLLEELNAEVQAWATGVRVLTAPAMQPGDSADTGLLADRFALRRERVFDFPDEEKR